MIVFSFLRSLIQWVLFLMALTFLVAWPLFCRIFTKNFSVHRFFLKMSAVFILISGNRITVEGREHIDPSKSYIVTFNHFNFFDHFFLYSILGIKLTGLEKEQHMKIPLYGRFMSIAGIIPIPQRGDTERAMRGLDVAKAKMKEQGYSILIAPEGTRCREGKLGSFKKGAFYMAVQTQSEILPVVYDRNMYKFHGRGRFMLYPQRITLRILPSITTKSKNEKDVTSMRNDLRQSYVEQVGESYIEPQDVS